MVRKLLVLPIVNEYRVMSSLLAGIFAVVLSISIFYAMNCYVSCKDKMLKLCISDFMHLEFIIPILIGTSSIFYWLIYSYNNSNNDKLPTKLDTFIKGAPAILALAFFLYQAAAGAFFATTSISLEEKCLKMDA